VIHEPGCKGCDIDPQKQASNLYQHLWFKVTGKDVPKPRAKTPCNVWRKTQRDAIEVELKKRGGSCIPKNQLAAARDKIAREMFSALSKEEQKRWKEKASEEHKVVLKSYEDNLNAPCSQDPTDLQKAIQGIGRFMQPLLDELCKITGWKAFLVMGGPEPALGRQLSFVNVNSGCIPGDVKMSFGASERVFYKASIVPVFGRFLKKCYTPEECRARALVEEDGQPSSPEEEEEAEELHTFHNSLDSDGQTIVPRPFHNLSSTIPAVAAPPGKAASATSCPGATPTPAQNTEESTSECSPSSDPSPQSMPAAPATPQTSNSDTSSPASPDPSPPQCPQPDSVPSETLMDVDDTDKPLPFVFNSPLVSPAPSRAPSPASAIASPQPCDAAAAPQPSSSSADEPPPSPSAASFPNHEAMDVEPQPSSSADELPPSPSAASPPNHEAMDVEINPPVLATGAEPPVIANGSTNDVESSTPCTRSGWVPSTAGRRLHFERHQKRFHNDEDTSSDSSTDSVSQPSKKHHRTATRSQKPITTPTDAPDWVKSVLQMFTSRDLGTGWHQLVEAWLNFERTMHYKEKGCLGTSGRPWVIKEWIRHHRSTSWLPQISDTAAYGAGFNEWWTSLQPEWRIDDDGGILFDDIEGDWTEMNRPGLNGLVSVVTALFFWGAALEGASNGDDWCAAVKDCYSVFNILCTPSA
ncbi:hypothetical protein CVT26_006169, partial [Gymnopilus dilepis]